MRSSSKQATKQEGTKGGAAQQQATKKRTINWGK